MKSILFAFAMCAATILVAQSSELVFEKTLIHSDEIYFDFGEASLRADGDSSLNAIIQSYNKRPKLNIEITAHTDAIGTSEANQKLSAARGESVKQFLIANGLAADIIQTSVFGEDKPQSDNDSDEGRQRNRRATIDIYQSIPITMLAGVVTDEKTGEGIEADVIVKSKDGADSTRSDITGKWEIKVPSNAVVSVDIYAEGYFFETKMLKTRLGKVESLTTSLPPMLVGETVAIKNLYFVGNKAELLPKSLPELPKVLKLMQINPLIKIEIGGHINHPNTPPVAKSSWDFQLSVRRAKLVYEYLIENGVSAERATFKGYGSSQMKFPRARSNQDQAANRRVEIKILETGKVISEE